MHSSLRFCALKLSASSKSAGEFAFAVAAVLADESIGLAEQCARRVLAACGEGDMLRTQLAILRRLARFTPADSVAFSRTIAQHCIAAEKYPFSIF